MRVLLTGAAGRAGAWLRRELRGRYELLRLHDALPVADPGAGEEAVQGDIAELDGMEQAMDGIDAVIHMAAVPDEQAFEPIFKANVIGAWTIYEAARRQGVRRVVFGSSNHAVGFYPRTTRIDVDAPHRPDGLYGLSKCWGEDVARLYADKHSIESLVIRIGNLGEQPVHVRSAAIWISPRDLAQLCAIGVERPGIGFERVYGISDNASAWYDNAAAERLGYAPQDRSQDHPGHATPETHQENAAVGLHFQGGSFCAGGYAGPWRP